MKTLITILAMLASNSVFAVTVELNADTESLVPKYVYECETAAKAKLQAQADAYGIKIDMSTIRISHFDSNMISSYITWSVDVAAGGNNSTVQPGTSLQKLTQKPGFGQCF